MSIEKTLGEIKKVTSELEKKINNHQWFMDNTHKSDMDDLQNKVGILHNMLSSIVNHYNIKMCKVCQQISDDVTKKQCNHRDIHCYAEQCSCDFLCCNRCYTSYSDCGNH